MTTSPVRVNRASRTASAAAPARAAIYLRISQDRTGAEAGVTRQEQDCRELAARNGWTVTEVFRDNDTSAFSGKVRPGYAAMIEAVELGQFDAILAWHPDRLYRRLTDLASFVTTVKTTGIDVATVKAGNVDLVTAAGRMQAGVLGVLAEYESEHKAERIRAAAKQRATAGRFSGGMQPYGFEKDGLTLIPAEVAAIRQAVESVLAGVSIAEVTRQMPPKTPKTVGAAPTQWRAQHLRNMLLSPRLAGLSSYDTAAALTQAKGAGQTADVAIFNSIVGKAAWPAIIPEATWRKAVAVLTDPARRTTPGSRPTHLLSGIVTCGAPDCGKVCRVSSRERGSDHSGVLRYRCPRGHTLRQKTLLENYVITETINVLTANTVHRTSSSRHRPAASAEATDARAQVERLSGKLASLAADYDEDLITRDQFTELTRRTRARIEVLAKVADPTPLPAVLAAVSEDKNGPAAAFTALDLPRKRALMRAMWRIVLVPYGKPTGTNRPDMAAGVQMLPQW